MLIIDAGHGGKDPGATFSCFRESDQVLGIAIRLREAMKNRGISTKMTRDSDIFIPLKDRLPDPKDKKDIFLSLHMNASRDHKGSGFESYVSLNPCAQSLKAQDLIHSYISMINKRYRIRDRGKKKADYYVLKNNKVPAVLIEFLFIDNDIDNIVGTNYYSQVATAIADAMEEYINLC